MDQLGFGWKPHQNRHCEEDNSAIGKENSPSERKDLQQNIALSLSN